MIKKYAVLLVVLLCGAIAAIKAAQLGPTNVAGSLTVNGRQVLTEVNGPTLVSTQTWSGINTFLGNVGIGTDSPSSRLEVFNGSITVRGTNAGVNIGGIDVLSAIKSSAALSSSQFTFAFSSISTLQTAVSTTGVELAEWRQFRSTGTAAIQSWILGRSTTASRLDNLDISTRSIREGNATSYITINSNTQTKSGALNVLGLVGVGTTVPNSTFNVVGLVNIGNLDTTDVTGSYTNGLLVSGKIQLGGTSITEPTYNGIVFMHNEAVSMSQLATITKQSGTGVQSAYQMAPDMIPSASVNSSYGYSSIPNFTASDVAISSAYGIYSAPTYFITGSGSIPQMYGGYFAKPFGLIGSAGKEIALYGDDLSVGYKSAAPTGGGIFSGNVGIGTNAPAQKLEVFGGETLLSTTTTRGWLTVNPTLTTGGSSLYLTGNYLPATNVTDSVNFLYVYPYSVIPAGTRSQEINGIRVGPGPLNNGDGVISTYTAIKVDVPLATAAVVNALDIYGSTLTLNHRGHLQMGSAFTTGTSTFSKQFSNIQLNLAGQVNANYNIAGATAPSVKLYINSYDNDTAGPGMYPIYVEDENSTQTPDFFLRSGTGGSNATAIAYFGGNVGIGSASPGGKLQIGPTDNNHLLMTSANNAYGWRIDTVDSGGGSVPLRIFRRTNSSDTEVLTIKNEDGNVGIGTTNPAYRLDVSSIMFSSKGLEPAGSGTGLSAVGAENSKLLFYKGSASNWAGMGVDAGGFWWLRTGTGGTNLMVMNSAGNVGIGTSVPIVRLDVQGGRTWLNNSSGDTTTRAAGLTVGYNKGSGYTSGTDPEDTGRGISVITTVDNRPAILALRNTARNVFWDIVSQGTGDDRLDFNRFSGSSYFTDMSINAGNVGIGTLTPARKLVVMGDARVGTGTTGCVEDADGTVIAGTCSSDERFKTIVGTMPVILSSFTMLEPKYFYWNSGEYPTEAWGSAKQLGLVAQEVEQVHPELVFTDDNGYKKVRYEQLPMYLLKSLKEAYEEIKDLKQRVSILEGQ